MSKDENARPPRAMLYQGGSKQIFEGEEAIAEAREAGWGDEPTAAEPDLGNETISDQGRDELEVNLAVANDTIADQKTQIETLTADLATANERADSNATAVAEAQETIESQAKEITSLKGQVTKLKKAADK